MKTWMVETTATVRRLYIVKADNEKEAIAKSCETPMDHEEDISEETTSVVETVTA